MRPEAEEAARHGNAGRATGLEGDGPARQHVGHGDGTGRVERDGGHALPRATEAKTKVLEVVKGADGLEVWYLGETFVLPKARGTRAP